MLHFRIPRAARALLLAALLAGSAGPAAVVANTPRPWMDPEMAPDERATLFQAQMTRAEQLALIRIRLGQPHLEDGDPAARGSAGFVKGIARLGMPDLQITDGPVGPNGGIGDAAFATPMPATLLTAATWNPALAHDVGAAMGRETWQKGYNILLAGGINLAREPRNGRNFEYSGEDPLLAGVMVGEAIRGIQSRGVISTVKHFALNSQETQRVTLNATMDEADMRESDLLAFQIAIERGRPGAVMCAYNRVGGDYACENAHLLNDVLKRDWRYPGWVMSDWGAVHSTVAAVMNGLDQQAPQAEHPDFFGKPLHDALAAGQVPEARLRDMNHRILRSLFAAGLFERPPVTAPLDGEGMRQAQRAAEEGIVLLRNRGDLLPLARTAKSIAVIGGRADVGVMSGGGSSQVRTTGHRTFEISQEETYPGIDDGPIYHPGAPLDAIRAAVPDAAVTFDDGMEIGKAAERARHAEIAIVFASHWNREVVDTRTLALSERQNRLIEAVSEANPRTIVVLQTGNPVLMPWLERTGAVLTAWYPGIGGATAIARILFGEVSPSGRLPLTFPRTEAQLPRPEIPGFDWIPKNPMALGEPFDVPHVEGANVGYRWYEARAETPLFPFGYGLSYTQFRYANLKAEGGEKPSLSVDVTNAGARAGMDVPQAYVSVAGRDGKPVRRLAGWQKLTLEPGETRRVTIPIDIRLLANYDAASPGWRIGAGDYAVAVAASATDSGLAGSLSMPERRLQP